MSLGVVPQDLAAVAESERETKNPSIMRDGAQECAVLVSRRAIPAKVSN